MLNKIRDDARAVIGLLWDKSSLEKGDIIVVGCSSSEVVGKTLGTGGSLEVAHALLEGMLPTLEDAGLHLAVQCCEHLNRALVVSAACAREYRLTEVTAVPHERAGGALATAYWRALERPRLVESIQAHAGLDIGLVMIGMHLRPVAVPLRLARMEIGAARVAAAMTRPRLIGGERARYE